MRTALGLVMMKGLTTPPTVEPVQNERVALCATKYPRLRQVRCSGSSAVAVGGVIRGAGLKPPFVSRGVTERRSARYGTAPAPVPIEVGGRCSGYRRQV